jgi:hypothetical protein
MGDMRLHRAQYDRTGRARTPTERSAQLLSCMTRRHPIGTLASRLRTSGRIAHIIVRPSPAAAAVAAARHRCLDALRVGLEERMLLVLDTALHQPCPPTAITQQVVATGGPQRKHRARRAHSMGATEVGSRTARATLPPSLPPSSACTCPSRTRRATP